METKPGHWSFVAPAKRLGCATYAPQVLVRTTRSNPAAWEVSYQLRVCNACDDVQRLTWILPTSGAVHAVPRETLAKNDFPPADYGFFEDGPTLTVALRAADGGELPHGCPWPDAPVCDPSFTPTPTLHEAALDAGTTVLILSPDPEATRFPGAPIFFDWRPEWAADAGAVVPRFDIDATASFVFVVPTLIAVDAPALRERPWEQACAAAAFPTPTACGFGLSAGEQQRESLKLVYEAVALPPPVIDAVRAHASP